MPESSSDDARLKRLIELARQVWPELERPFIWTDESVGDVMAAAELDDEGIQYIHVHPHPRALDALEAALLVLTGEVKGWIRPLGCGFVAEHCGNDDVCSAEAPQFRADLAEELAKEWEQEASERPGQQVAVVYRSCAVELRNRAREWR
jgi:hypothetical protein